MADGEVAESPMRNVRPKVPEDAPALLPDDAVRALTDERSSVPSTRTHRHSARQWICSSAPTTESFASASQAS